MPINSTNLRRVLRLLILAPLAVAASGCATPKTAGLESSGQGRKAFNRDNYSKREQLVPMRDGVGLFTAVYAPKDTSKTYPILMVRTPYSSRPYGVGGCIFLQAGLRFNLNSEARVGQLTDSGLIYGKCRLITCDELNRRVIRFEVIG